MTLTSAQYLTLKNDILADPILNALPPNSDSAFVIADEYNKTAIPDYYVWKTSLLEHDITGKTSPEGTNWSWPAFIARSVGEQTGWIRMFNSSLQINPSLANVRQGILDIFSGSANSAPAQRTHISAMAKRKASRVEKLLASGTGTLATPSTMDVEGPLTYVDVKEAMGW